MAAAAAQIGWVLVLIMSGSILECSPAWAAIAASPKHGAAALTVAAPQQRGWAACKTGCNALERARAAVQLETSSTSAAAGRGEGLPAVTNRGVEAIPCICGASAGTNDNQLAETAFCRRERKKCAKECGGKDHMYFMCEDVGGARAVSCACVSAAAGAASLAHAGASGPVCGTPQALRELGCILDWGDTVPARHLLQAAPTTNPFAAAPAPGSKTPTAAPTAASSPAPAVTAAPTSAPAAAAAAPAPEQRLFTLAPSETATATAAPTPLPTPPLIPAPTQPTADPPPTAGPSPVTNTSPDGSTQTSTSGNGQAAALSPTGSSASGPPLASGQPTVAEAAAVSMPAPTAAPTAAPVTVAATPAPAAAATTPAPAVSGLIVQTPAPTPPPAPSAAAPRSTVAALSALVPCIGAAAIWVFV